MGKMRHRFGFPINRCHQRVATLSAIPMFTLTLTSFQSIGVTNEWRRCEFLYVYRPGYGFPINRCHQRVATCYHQDKSHAPRVVSNQ